MDLILLLDFISGLDEQQKEQVLTEEYERQNKLVNALCESKRQEVRVNANSRI